MSQNELSTRLVQSSLNYANFGIESLVRDVPPVPDASELKDSEKIGRSVAQYDIRESVKYTLQATYLFPGLPEPEKLQLASLLFDMGIIGYKISRLGTIEMPAEERKQLELSIREAERAFMPKRNAFRHQIADRITDVQAEVFEILMTMPLAEEC